MPRYRHPRALDGARPQIAVSLNGNTIGLDADGCFETSDEDAVASLAAAYGVDVDRLRVGDSPPSPPDEDTATCDAIKSDGEVCGRSLPCRYHDDD